MEKIRPLIWNKDALLLLDQRLLPWEKKYIPCHNITEVEEAIRKMVVRGAPAIGVTAVYAMLLAARELASSPEINDGNTFKWELFLRKLAAAGNTLKMTRPTAVNLSWGVDKVIQQAEEQRGASPDVLLLSLEELASNIYTEDIAVNKKIGAHGATLLSSPCTILTHCNAGALATAGYGTALGIVRSAYKDGKVIQVYANETRPFLQGARLTAWELLQEGIPVTLIIDSAAGYFLQRGQIDCVIVGADRIAANGDVANKIGTYMLAVLAEKNKVPFYVAAPRSTFDFSISSGEEILVEERAGTEITLFNGVSLAPEGVRALNPSFDITPASLITAIITEYGIINRPGQKTIRDFFTFKSQEDNL